MIRPKLAAAAFLWLAVLSPAPLCSAGIVTVFASGEIDLVDPALASVFAVGQPIALAFSFDDSTASSFQTANEAFYLAITTAQWTSPGYSASGNMGPIDITNDLPSGTGFLDAWETGAVPLTGPAVGAYALQYVIATLGAVNSMNSSDPSIAPTMLTSTALTQPVPTQFADSSLFKLHFSAGDAAAEVHGVFTNITVLPEPESLGLLVGVGAAALAAARRSSRRRAARS